MKCSTVRCSWGGLRTALFNYLFARQHGSNGTFVLRIEDTDQVWFFALPSFVCCADDDALAQTRLVAGSQQRLVGALRWAGLRYDEGDLSLLLQGPS